MSNPIEPPIKHGCGGCGKCSGGSCGMGCGGNCGSGCNECSGVCFIKRLLKKALHKKAKQNVKPIVKKLMKPIIKSMVKSLTPIALRQDLTFKSLLLLKPEDPPYKSQIPFEEIIRDEFEPHELDDYFAEVRFIEQGMWYLITWMFINFFPGKIHRFSIYYRKMESGEFLIEKLLAKVEDPETGTIAFVRVPQFLALIGLIPDDLVS